MIGQKLILNLFSTSVFKSQDLMSNVELFLENNLFHLFTRETNLYYFQQKDNSVNKSATKNWTNTTTAEMKKFLGLVIIMRTAKKP